MRHPKILAKFIYWYPFANGFVFHLGSITVWPYVGIKSCPKSSHSSLA